MVDTILLRTYLLLGTLAVPLTMPANAASTEERRISVDAMPLPAALDAIARQAGRTITYDPDSVPGKTSAPVRGATGALQAVRAALRGTGLSTSVNPDGVITVGNDIVVTATRDEAETSFRVDGAQSSNRSGKSLKELPQGTEVLTAALFRQQQALTLGEALRNSAGVANSVGNLQGTATFRIRGNTASALQNGVVSEAGSTPIDTVERIEVLKGPSAILAGADGLGGVVNIVDKRPSADPILDVYAQYGTFGDRKVAIDASNALNDSKTLSARIIGVQAGSDRSYGGYMGRREEVIAPSLRYKTAATDVIVGMNASYTRNPLANFRIIDPTTSSGFLDTPSRIGPREQGFYNSVTRYYASAEQRVASWFTLAARGSYTRDSLKAAILAPLGFFDPDNAAILTAYPQSINNQQRNAAADVYGRFTFATGPMRHTLSAGYNYSRLALKSYQTEDGGDPYVSFDVFGDSSNLVLPAPGTILSYDQTVLQNGAYVQDFVDLGKLHVLAAVRRNSYKVRTRIVDTGSGGSDQTDSVNATTPSIGAVYDVTRLVSVYANYQQGFEPSFGLTCDGDRLPNVTSQNIEGGVKADFFAKRLSATTSVYQLRQNNVAIDDFTCAIAGRSRAQGGQTTRGVELTLNGRVAAGLNVSASYSFADNRVQNPSEVFGTIPPLLYRHKYSAYVSYERQAGGLKGLGIAGGVFGNGRSYIDSFGQYYVRPQAELDANVSYRLGKVLLNVGVKNLTNRDLSSVAGNPSYVPYLQPRTVLVSLAYNVFK